MAGPKTPIPPKKPTAAKPARPACVWGTVIVADKGRPDGVLDETLRADGWTVLRCRDARSAVTAAKEHTPDIVVLDIDLPEADFCARVLKRCDDTRRAVIMLASPTACARERVKLMVDAGAQVLLAKPVVAPILRAKVADALRRLRAAPGPRDLASTSATRRVQGNRSLLYRPLECVLHEAPVPVARYLLRTGAVQSEPNFFDLPVYLAAAPGNDFVDFNVAGLIVCPRCLLSSTDPAHFREVTPPAAASEAPPPPAPVFEAGVAAALRDAAPQRGTLAAVRGPDFFTHRRTPADAIVAYRVAIACSRTIIAASPFRVPTEVLRQASYHLRLAHLYERTRSAPALADEALRSARALVGEAYTLAQGPNFFKAAYQAIALALWFGDDREAWQYLAKMNELDQSPTLSKDDRGPLQRYHARARRAWEDRALHRSPTLPATAA